VIKEDEELDKLEEDIRKLKTKYDSFFSGIIKVPPMHERRMLEVYLHELSKLKIRDNGRRFRLTQLLTRYNQFRELWGRKMREREEGPLEYRRRRAALTGEEPEAAAPPPPPPRPRPRPVTSNPADPYVMVTPGTNGVEIRRLYAEIERQHLKLGKLPPVSFDQLAAMVQKQSEAVRSRYHVQTVAFRVETIDGKVKLKAKPVQE